MTGKPWEKFIPGPPPKVPRKRFLPVVREIRDDD